MKKYTLSQLAYLALRRSGAYKRMFKTKDQTTLNEDARVVLADLKRFCRADGTSTFNENPYKMALLEGRREVFERMRAYIEANDADIHRLQETVPTE